MAFKLSKAEAVKRQQHIDKLRELHSKLEDAVNKYNEKLSELQGPVDDVLAELNEAVTLAGSWVENLAGEKRGEFDEKSERWQESDRGQNVSSWLDELEGVEYGDAQIDFPGGLSMPSDGEDLAEAIENLPAEADEG